MPTYEYHCDGCGQNVEVFHSMTAPPAEVCPNCGAKKLHRLISGGSGIIFKGSGFYCTDYKKSSAATSGISSEKPTSESSSSSETSKKTASKETETKTTSEKADSKSASKDSSSKTKK